jgi:hypothetical protein
MLYMIELRAVYSKRSVNSTFHVKLPLTRGNNGKFLIRRYNDFVEILRFFFYRECFVPVMWCH